MKIPFDIKYRPQIESGEYKVETRSGLPARIVCWDRNSKDMEILALVYDEHIDENNEELAEVALDGRMFPRGKDHDYDLFIVTQEEELTEFEQCLLDFAKARDEYEYDSTKVVELNDKVIELTKSYAKKLLAIAKRELQLEIDAEIEKAYKTQDDVVFRKGWEQGRADALKDLPKWIRDDSIKAEQYITVGKNGSRFHYKGHSLLISDLTKLPGFNED